LEHGAWSAELRVQILRPYAVFPAPNPRASVTP
jgi:hypothetical protein